MKMEVRVFTASPILVDEITDWFKGQLPRIPITVSVAEREGESRVAVYALFLDAPIVGGIENEALLALLERWQTCGEAYVTQFDELHMPHDTLDALIAHTALALKKAGRA